MATGAVVLAVCLHLAGNTIPSAPQYRAATIALYVVEAALLIGAIVLNVQNRKASS